MRPTSASSWTPRAARRGPSPPRPRRLMVCGARPAAPRASPVTLTFQPLADVESARARQNKATMSTDLRRGLPEQRLGPPHRPPTRGRRAGGAAGAAFWPGATTPSQAPSPPARRTPRPPIEMAAASPHPFPPAPLPTARLLHAPPRSRSPRPPALLRPLASVPRGRFAALALERRERPAERRDHRRLRRPRCASCPQRPAPRTPVTPLPMAAPPHPTQQQLSSLHLSPPLPPSQALGGRGGAGRPPRAPPPSRPRGP